MKFTVKKEAFSTALARIIGAVEKRATLPVLTHVKVTLLPNKTVILTATDLEVRASQEIDVEVGDAIMPASVCLPAEILKGIVDNAPDPSLHFTAKKEVVLILSCRVRSLIATLPGDEFPGDDHTSSFEAVRLPADLLPSLLRAVGHAASTDATKYNLQGVFLTQRGDNFTAVATDGHRLSVAAVGFDSRNLAFDRGLIIPTKAGKILKPITAGLNVDIDDKQIHFDSGRFVLSSGLLDAQYPDVFRIVPAELPNNIVVDSAALIAAIEACGVVAEDEGKSVKLIIEDEQITVTALGTCGTVSAVVPCSGAAILEIRFNSRYLIQALKALGGEIFFKFADNSTSVMLIPFDHGQWDERFELIMPIRV